MENKLKILLNLAKSLPENRLDAAIEKLTKIKQDNSTEKPVTSPECPQCGGSRIVLNGH